MVKSLKLGKLANIGIYVHWSFLLLVLWIIYDGLSRNLSLLEGIFSFVVVGTSFFCVVLHELGHALAARRYGIGTKNIILLPIGGVALLERMPDKPSEELVVAIAGPLVNVVIACFIAVLLGILYLIHSFTGLLAWDSWLTYFLFVLLAVNGMLIVFNAIPAFPMDGGRVLRSLLAMRMNKVKATTIATRLGQLIAVGFAVYAIFFGGYPFLLLIALFIFFVAPAEEKMVRMESALEGYVVKDMLSNDVQVIDTEQDMAEIVSLLRSVKDKNFIVTENNEIVGTLKRENILQGIKNQADNNQSLVDWINRRIIFLNASLSASEAFQRMNAEGYDILPVKEDNKIIGFVDRMKMNRYVQILGSK